MRHGPIAQLIEAYGSRGASGLTAPWHARPGGGRSLHGLPARPHGRGRGRFAGAGSLLSGICLANAGLGAVHALASPIGAFFPSPHGAVCAALLPPALELNAHLANEAEDTVLLEKYALAWQLFTGWVSSTPAQSSDPFGGETVFTGMIDNTFDASKRFVSFLAALRRDLRIPGLATGDQGRGFRPDHRQRGARQPQEQRGRAGPRRAGLDPGAGALIKPMHWLLLGMVVVGAGALRFADLGGRPGGLFTTRPKGLQRVGAGDQRRRARIHARGGAADPLGAPAVYDRVMGVRTSLTYQYASVPFMWAGGLTVATTRMAAAAAGTLAVLLVGWLMMRAWGPGIGVAAALWTALCPWHSC